MSVYSLNATAFDREGQRVKLCGTNLYVTRQEACERLAWFAGVVREHAEERDLDLSKPLIVVAVEHHLTDRGWTIDVKPRSSREDVFEGRAWGCWTEAGQEAAEVKQWVVDIQDVKVNIKFARLEDGGLAFQFGQFNGVNPDEVRPGADEAKAGPDPQAGVPGP